MDTDFESNLLSMDYRTPTISNDLSNTLVQSKLKEQFGSEKHVNNVGITQLFDAAVTVLNYTETQFQKIKSDSCQINAVVSDSSDFDSDEILSFDKEHSNVEPVSLELELSLLDYDLDSKKVADPDQTISVKSDLSSNAADSSSSLTSGNIEPINDSSCMNQMLINFSDSSLSLEKALESGAEIKVPLKLNLSPEKNGTTDDHRFSCAYPNEEIVNSGVSPIKEISTDHQNSTSINATKSNILPVDCTSSGDRSSSKHVTIDNSIGGKLVPSKSVNKLQEKTNDLSYRTLSKISNILKDCNDNVFDSYFDQEILSLESVSPAKTHLSNPRSELRDHLKENSSDVYTDPRSLRSDGESLTFPVDQNCQSVPKKNSCNSRPLLKRKISSCFVPANDFKKKVNKAYKDEIPSSLIAVTTPDGDKIKVLNADTGFSSSQENCVSLHIKSCQTAKREVLKQSLKIDVKAKPEKCLKNEDSQILNLTDVCIKEEAKIFTTVKTPLEFSSDSSVIKSKLLTLKDHGNSLTDGNNIQKDNLKCLFESSSLEVNATGMDSKISAQDKQLKDCPDKTTQNLQQTMNEHLKNNPENENSKLGNQCRNSKDVDVLTSSFSKVNQSRNESEQQSPLNKLKEKPEGCVDATFKDSSSSLEKLMLKNPLPMIISVNTDGGNQKRTVMLGKQLIKGENSSVILGNKDEPVKCLNKTVTVRNQSDNLQIKINSNFNKTHTELSLNKSSCKDSKNLPKDSDTITGKIPTVVSLTGQCQTTPGKTVTKSKIVPQKNTLMIPMGVKKRKKAKKSSAKKRAKTLRSLSKKTGLSLQTIVANAKANNTSTDFKSNAKTSSGSVPKTGSNNSLSICKQTRQTNDANVKSEGTSSNRKFVKAKRGLYKQKQEALCVDKSDVNDRLQWVCQRWNVETLSNQDINLTTASYIRRKLPVQEAAFFQGCLEGQKDYTLAIVAPNRKRKLHNDDTNIADYNASKKRRLGDEIELIPDNVKELPPDRKLIGNKAIELLATSHTMCLIALDRQRNQEINMFNRQYSYLQYQLQEKHFQERQYYNYYRRFDQEEGWFRLQNEHHYQKQQFHMAMKSRHNDLIARFANKANELHMCYDTSIDKLKSDLSADETDSGYLTVALRMGPNRRSGYKTTHRNVCLTSQVALAMIMEDEIYDLFYSHKSEFD